MALPAGSGGGSRGHSGNSSAPRGGLYVIDGYSIIYRGYFAFLNRPLTNPQGRNVSSVFVFFRTLLELVRNRNPDAIAVAMDSITPTFRHERFPQYKATRDKAPPDLHAQVPVIEEILLALGVASVRVDGFEADDLIATLAEGCRSGGRPCWIVSGDKDVLQVVGSNIRVLAPGKGGTALVELGPREVLESRGVPPERIVDFLALTGDSSDNVPGVPGVGEKTAVKLLTQFDGLDDIYRRIAEVTPESLRRKLVDGRQSAELSRELVTLRRDVAGLPPPGALAFRDLNAAAAIPLFEREGMRSIAQELAGKDRAAQPALDLAEPADEPPADEPPATEPPATEPAPPQPAAAPVVETMASTKPGTYPAITDMQDLDRAIAACRDAGRYAFDFETDSTDEMRAIPLGFSLAWKPGSACYVPLRAADVTCLPTAAVKERLARLLADRGPRLVGQNVKFDMKVGRRWGLAMPQPDFDTMLAAWILDSDAGTYGLDRLAGKYLNYRTQAYRDLVAKDGTLADLPAQRAADYSGEDADLTLRLALLLAPELGREGLTTVLRDIEMPLVGVLADMELAGIRILPRELERYGAEIEDQLAALEEEIYALCGRRFNINSTRQLQEILFTWRKLTPVRKTRTGYSTDVDVLEALAAQDPVPEKILEHRKLSKLKSTYIDALPRLVNEETGRLHTSYVQTGAATGRLSSKDPNLQNIPIREEEGRRIRSAFVPAAGMRFVSADYAQIELAILAHLSGDPTLLEAFRQGKDIHCQTAALIFGVDEPAVTPDQRRVAKTINFGVVYGMSAFGLAQRLKISRSDADLFIRTYFERYREVDRFLKETIRSAEERGYVQTLFGRRRGTPTIRSRNRAEKQAAERAAVNSPIQGSAADVVKLAMISLAKRLVDERLPARILLQVHDEIILEADEQAAGRVMEVARETMEHVTTQPIPLVVHCEQGSSWGDFH